jgi:hypothetical protein
MQASSQASECFTKVFLLTPVVSAGVDPTKVDTPREGPLDVPERCGDSEALVGDVILHAGTRVDLELDGIDGASESRIPLSGVLVIGVVFRVIDVLFRSVYPQSLGRHFEFFRGVAWKRLVLADGTRVVEDSTYPNDIKDRIQTKTRIVSAGTPLRVPTSTAWL